MKYLFIIVFIAATFFSCKTASTQANETIKVAENKADILIRWSEKYGSVCCKRDPQHDNHILSYIKKFEASNNVKLQDSYSLITGREGEGYYCLTLNGLSKKQREAFILNRYPEATKAKKKELLDRINHPKPIKDIIEQLDLIDRLKKFN